MIIADTSVWIEYLKGNSEITRVIVPYLRRNHIIASSAIFGELLQGVKNEREFKLIKGFWDSLPKMNEDHLFIKAGELSGKYKLYAKWVGLIDCYILAAALKYDYGIWTLDKKLFEVVDHMNKIDL